MVFHPRENWDIRRGRRDYTRREFIQRSAALGVLLPGVSSLLAACGGGEGELGELVIGTPTAPVTQPLRGEAVASGLPVEEGPLRIYNWADYINPDVLPRFTEETGIETEVSIYYNEEEAIRKLSSGEVSFDVWFPVASSVAKSVAGGLVQPINHDYLPNLANVWSTLQDPYYDGGAQYTVPYVLYTTGIGWRVDMVDSADVEGIDMPWDVFWNSKYKDITGLYDDYRETLKVSAIRNGSTDPDNIDQSELDAAADSLIELVDLVNIRYTIDGAYVGIPEGRYGLHHAWSGDMVNAAYYFPEDGDPSVTRYLWPAKAENPAVAQIANDTMTVLAGAEHPVAAHTFINWMLDNDNALENFGWMGYQPPISAIDPATLIADEWVAPNVETAIITPEDFENPNANVPIQFQPDVDAAWLEAWSRVQGTA